MRRRRASASSSDARDGRRARSVDEDDGRSTGSDADADVESTAREVDARERSVTPPRAPPSPEYTLQQWYALDMTRAIDRDAARADLDAAFEAYDAGRATARDAERFRPRRLAGAPVDVLMRLARRDPMLVMTDAGHAEFKLVALALAALRLSEFDETVARAGGANGDGEAPNARVRREAEWVLGRVNRMRNRMGQVRTSVHTGRVERDFAGLHAFMIFREDEVRESTLCLRALIAMATGGANGALARTSAEATNDLARRDLREYEHAKGMRQTRRLFHRGDQTEIREEAREFHDLLLSYAERLQDTPFLLELVERRGAEGELGIHQMIESAGVGLSVAFENELENATFFLFVLNVWGVTMFEYNDDSDWERDDSELEFDSESDVTDDEDALDDMEDDAVRTGRFHQNELWQKEDAFWNCSPYVRTDYEQEKKKMKAKSSCGNDRAGFCEPSWIPLGLNHQQGADSLCATISSDFSHPALDGSKLNAWHMHIFASGTNGVSAWTTSSEETGSHLGPRGSTLERRYAQLDWRTEAEKFRVYSMAFDDETRTLAVCGMSPYYGVNHNVIVYRVAVSATERMRDRVEPMHAQHEDVVFIEESRVVDHYYQSDDGSDAHRDSPAWDFVELCRANVGAPTEHVGEYDPMQDDGVAEADQANCIRFGRLAVDENNPRVLRLLLSSNDGYVYVCRLEERRNRAEPSYRLVKDFVIHHSDAVNCAVPSPCGRMIASGCDSREVHVMTLSTLTSEVREFDKKRGMRPVRNCRSTVGGDSFKLIIPGENCLAIPGSDRRSVYGSVQYLAWSSDGRYLAATNDHGCTVTVWLFKDRCPTCKPCASASSQNATSTHEYRMDGVVRIAFIFGHQLPCLPVRFGIANPSLMVWAERGGRIHMFDVRQAEEHYEDVYRVHEALRAREPAHLDELKDHIIDYNRCANVDMGYDSMYNRTKIPPENDRWENLTFEQRCALTTRKEEEFMDGRKHSLGKYFAVQTFRRGGYSLERNNEFITGLSVIPHTNGRSASDIILFSSRQNIKALRAPAGMNIDRTNFNEIPHAAQRAMMAFLLCVKASRRNAAPGTTCLADLPDELIHDILVKMASPFYVWSIPDAAFYRSSDEASYKFLKIATTRRFKR